MSLQAPQSIADALAILGDTHNRSLPIYRSGEDGVATLATAVFNLKVGLLKRQHISDRSADAWRAMHSLTQLLKCTWCRQAMSLFFMATHSRARVWQSSHGHKTSNMAVSELILLDI